MKNISVLICDDNEVINKGLADYLESSGMIVYSAYTGEKALEMLKTLDIDLIVLDIMLPGIDGYTVCKEIRKVSNTYIIMISARGEEIDRVLGLELGADDYLTKPVSPRELTIKIKKAMSRSYAPVEHPKYTMGELTVYPDSYQVFYNKEAIQLTAKEAEILIFMMSNPRKILSRERIVSAVWGYEYTGDNRSVDTLVKRLRQKIVRGNDHFKITAVYGIGYKMEELIDEP